MEDDARLTAPEADRTVSCHEVSILTKLQTHSTTRLLVATTVGLFLSAGRLTYAQGAATAVQPLALSAFGMGTGTWTNVSGGRNLGITAGVDLAFLTYRKLRPVAEIRGNYPFYEGQVDRQKSFTGGLRVERQIGPLRPYVNFLIGRGEADFKNGYLNGNLLYLKTVSTVYSPGFGVEYDVTPHWTAKVDFQYQSWNTPAVPSGTINPKALSAGVVYRFDFNHHYKVRRRDR